MRAVKIAVSVVVVVGGLGALVYSTSSGSVLEYYKHVDEVVDDLPRWDKTPLQLHGFVLPGSIQRRLDTDRNQQEFKFIAVNCGKQVNVRYAGSVPDTFKDGAEVVCKGTFVADAAATTERVFKSTEVMAKCPSKYQATGTGPAGENKMCSRGRGN
jgi:cytochrome c-type biogenesis protein CcmE